MKHVFPTSSDVIHLFAQRTQDNARMSSYQVYFEGNKIYSYGSHYLLGEFIDDNTIMINDSGYSVTTAKHISELRYATTQYKQYFKTQCDLDLVLSEVRSLSKLLSKARKPIKYTVPMIALWEAYNRFVVERKVKKYKSDLRYKEVKTIVETVIEGGTGIEESQAFIKKTKAAYERRAKRLYKEKIEQFANHELNSIYMPMSMANREDFVRVSKDGLNVETSQQVRIPIKDATLLYKLIAAKKDIKGYKIQNYTVISLNGTLTIGCHRINTESMHSVGKCLLSME